MMVLEIGAVTDIFFGLFWLFFLNPVLNIDFFMTV